MRHNLILFLFLYSLCGFAQFYVQQINPLDLTIIKLFKKVHPPPIMLELKLLTNTLCSKNRFKETIKSTFNLLHLHQK